MAILSAKSVRVTFRAKCGVTVDKPIFYGDKCNHANSCKSKPKWIMLKVYPMYNEIERERAVCRDHAYAYGPDENKRKCKLLSYHWHSFKIHSIPMMWQK